MLKEACKEAGSQKAFAKKIGISEQYLSDVIKGRRDIGASIARGLDLRETPVWVRMPLKLLPKHLWTLQEIMEDVKYND